LTSANFEDAGDDIFQQLEPEIKLSSTSPPGSNGRVGVDAVDRVFLMENHDHAYHLWKEAGFRDRILVHIDAHHDMWWLDDIRSLSIANFVCQAIKDEIVREIYWVVPDQTWDTSQGRTAVRRHLRDIVKSYPGNSSSERWSEDSVRAEVNGRPLVVCSLQSLPTPTESVLLDIDVDYLAVQSVSFGKEDTYGSLPWRWPDQLVAGLRERDLRTDFVTICYSIEGGYTPLQWKYLGDELRSRIRDPGDAQANVPYEQMRNAATARALGNFAAAKQEFRTIGDELGAAPHFSLAYLLAEEGHVDEARSSYQRGLTIDPLYRAPYSSPGVQLYLSRVYDEAEHAFQQTLQLDADDPYAHLGLSWIALARRNWTHAEAHARTALALEPNLIDAHRALAKALRKQNRFAEAIEEYEQSLKLGLSGHKGFTGVIVTSGATNRVLDGEHVQVHARLAMLHEQMGDYKRAIASYRIAIASGHDYPLIRFRVAHLYARQRRWKDAAFHFSRGLMRAPIAARRLRSFISQKFQ
jgi:tetratricopeptide (TPR) repeat protein